MATENRKWHGMKEHAAAFALMVSGRWIGACQ